MSSNGQVWHIPLKPAQRWQLHELAFAQGRKIPDGHAGRRFRRFLTAFGLRVIAESLRKDPRVKAALANGDERKRHTITAENLEQALEVLGQPRTPHQELVLGELQDLLEDLKAGGEPPDVSLLPEYEPENWGPPDADEDQAEEKAAG